MLRTASVFFILALCAAPAAAQTFGVTNISNTPPTGAPVQIEDCKTGQDGGLLIAQSDGNFEISFTNEGAPTWSASKSNLLKNRSSSATPGSSRRASRSNTATGAAAATL